MRIDVVAGIKAPGPHHPLLTGGRTGVTRGSGG